ncbi:MAG: hypothetical protein ABEJ58_00730, partial [Halodesulfurarchaeum sp.]
MQGLPGGRKPRADHTRGRMADESATFGVSPASGELCVETEPSGERERDPSAEAERRRERSVKAERRRERS